MNMLGCRRSTSRFKRRLRFPHRFLERLRPTRHYRTFLELPSDPLPYEEIIQLVLKLRRFWIFVRFFISLLKVRPDLFDDVVNLKPLAVIYMPLDLTPDIRIGTPVARVRSFF